MTPAPWSERFDRFDAAKTARAASARLWPYETDYAADPSGLVAVASPWTASLFDGPFYLRPPHDDRRPACSLVFVQSADGNTGAADPSSLGGGETDTHLIYEGLSRVAADAVLAGAETVRDADIVFSVWHPEVVRLRAALGLPRHPTQVIATIRGVPVERMLSCNVPEIPVIIMTGAAGAAAMRKAVEERPWISMIAIGGPDELPRGFAELRARGVHRVSCVGGRTLASHLLQAGLVDEVFLTTAARAGGDPGTPLSSRPWRGPVLLRKRGTGAEAGVVFEHLLPRHV